MFSRNISGKKNSVVTYRCLHGRLWALRSARRFLGDDSVTHSEVWRLSVHQRCCYHNNHYAISHKHLRMFSLPQK